MMGGMSIGGQPSHNQYNTLEDTYLFLLIYGAKRHILNQATIYDMYIYCVGFYPKFEQCAFLHSGTTDNVVSSISPSRSLEHRFNILITYIVVHVQTCWMNFEERCLLLMDVVHKYTSINQIQFLGWYGEWSSHMMPHVTDVVLVKKNLTLFRILRYTNGSILSLFYLIRDVISLGTEAQKRCSYTSPSFLNY